MIPVCLMPAKLGDASGKDKAREVKRGCYTPCTWQKTHVSLVAMSAVELTAKAIGRYLDKILENRAFERNQRLSRFLRLAVERHLEGRDHELKESVIGIEIFGRKPDYDPKSDGIVRTEARRLRALLNEYYLRDGRGDPVIIELPKGGYVPVIRSREPESALSASRPASLWWRRRWVTSASVVALLALAAVGLTRFDASKGPITIAVLPLVDMSPDSQGDYFADGLTGELISNLSIVEGLAVRSQTSSFVFKGKPRNIHEAGTQLGVEYILEGSVLRDSGQLRVLVQLVRARDDQPLWSGRYDRDISRALAMQDEISRGIVNSLRLKLGRGRWRYETSEEAYDLYLRARALEIQKGLRGVNEGVGFYERAIAKDSSFAPAYAGLAAAYAARTGEEVIRFGPPIDRTAEMAKMRPAAEKALRLDPLLAEAHDAMGMVQSRDAEWAQAEKSFRRALELDPNSSLLRRHFILDLLMPLGRVQEALQQVRIEEKVDPLSPQVQSLFANVLIAAGQFEEAAAHCRKLSTGGQGRLGWLARALIGQGKAGDAVRTLEGASDYGDVVTAVLGVAYAQAGRRAEAERIAAELPSPLQAQVFAALGDKGRTFDALHRSIPLGGTRIGRELNLPEFSFLRGDPRLKALRKSVGLPA
jgi:TolB-like protein